MLSVSVIIPTYNGARFVADALRSALEQSAVPCEIIVVDDCSRDDTLGIVRGIAESTSVAIRIIALPQNSGGPARPINIGIGMAIGDLIAVLDQDDVFAPDKLQSQARVLSENPDVSLVAGFWGPMGGSSELNDWSLRQRSILKELISTSQETNLPTIDGRSALCRLIVDGNLLKGYPAFMFRKKDWHAKGGVNESLPVASDYDLLCWLCTIGSVVIEPVVQYSRREHETNVCNNTQRMYLDLTRVRGRYLAANRWLLDDPAVTTPMREWFGSFAGSLREAGNYQAAWECYRMTARVWGWTDIRLLLALCKFPVHWLWCRLTKRPPIYTCFTELGERSIRTAMDVR